MDILSNIKNNTKFSINDLNDDFSQEDIARTINEIAERKQAADELNNDPLYRKNFINTASFLYLLKLNLDTNIVISPKVSQLIRMLKDDPTPTIS